MKPRDEVKAIQKKYLDNENEDLFRELYKTLLKDLNARAKGELDHVFKKAVYDKSFSLSYDEKSGLIWGKFVDDRVEALANIFKFNIPPESFKELKKIFLADLDQRVEADAGGREAKRPGSEAPEMPAVQPEQGPRPVAGAQGTYGLGMFAQSSPKPPAAQASKLSPAAQSKLSENQRDEYICPMTLCVMRNPTMASDGRVYEKDKLIEVYQEALKNGNTPISPITRLELKDSLDKIKKPSEILVKAFHEVILSDYELAKNFYKTHRGAFTDPKPELWEKDFIKKFRATYLGENGEFKEQPAEQGTHRLGLGGKG